MASGKFRGHFKIVACLRTKGETKEFEYCYIPHLWEQNGSLFWPQQNMPSLRENPVSEPGPNWLVYKCILKKDGIKTLDEAVLWEHEYIEQYVNATTEDVDENLPNPKKAKTMLDKENEFEGDTLLLNQLSPSLPTASTTAMDEDVSLSVPELKNNNNSENQVSLNQINSKLDVIIRMNGRIQKQLFDFESTQKRAVMGQIDKMWKDLMQKYNNYKENSNFNNSIQPEPDVITNKFTFPLNDIQSVQDFNNELTKNADYKIYMISSYSFIGGTEGNEEGKVILRKLIAILFTKYVLTLFSWTGISRTHGLEKKEPFQSLTGIVTLFYEIGKLADSRWTETKNENLFKNHILKHAKQINAAFEKKQIKHGANETLSADEDAEDSMYVKNEVEESEFN